MKKQLSLLLIMAITLALSGCANDGGIYQLPVNDETVQEAIKYTADSSVLKEAEVHATLRNRDKMISKDNSKPSFELSWKPVEETYQFLGMEAPVKLTRVYPDIKVTEKKQYTQTLPIEPSKHPVWSAVEKGIGAVERGWLGWLLGNAYKTSAESMGTKYNGPYAPNNQNYNNAFNQTAEPYFAPVQ